MAQRVAQRTFPSMRRCLLLADARRRAVGNIADSSNMDTCPLDIGCVQSNVRAPLAARMQRGTSAYAWHFSSNVEYVIGWWSVPPLSVVHHACVTIRT